MPKRWKDYSLQQKLRLQPLFHAIKQWRYQRIDRRYLKTAPLDHDGLADVRDSIKDSHLVTTIAFNDVQTICWQLDLATQFLCESKLLICDNSSNREASAKIRRACAERKVGYVRLPENPWTGKNPSRSHGASMNWVWHNIIRPGSPKTFGFIDHDLYPIAEATPHRQIGSCGCFGDKRWSGARWYLWAGYCFFDFKAMVDQPLDFGLDWFLGLDTGGANWEVLYQHISADAFPQRPLIEVAALDDVPLKEAYYETRGDDWIHEVGLAGDLQLRPRKREFIRQLLGPHLPQTRAA